MLVDTIKDLIKDLSPPVTATGLTFMGFALPDWLMLLTIAYAAVRLLALVPKLIGCATCFFRSKGCPLTCKSNINE